MPLISKQLYAQARARSGETIEATEALTLFTPAAVGADGVVRLKHRSKAPWEGLPDLGRSNALIGRGFYTAVFEPNVAGDYERVISAPLSSFAGLRAKLHVGSGVNVSEDVGIDPIRQFVILRQTPEMNEWLTHPDVDLGDWYQRAPREDAQGGARHVVSRGEGALRQPTGAPGDARPGPYRGTQAGR